MYAFRGDEIVVVDRRSGTRRARVLEGDHADGHPPYWVRWDDTGEEGLWSPTPGAEVEHAGPAYPPEYDPA
jgi:hypothetical protein